MALNPSVINKDTFHVNKTNEQVDVAKEKRKDNFSLDGIERNKSGEN